MKDLCEQCEFHESCPYGQIDFLEKVTDDIEEIIEDHDGVDLKPDVTLGVIKCNTFVEV